MVEVLDKEKPRDQDMLKLLREFMYIVCTKKFTPVFKKIGTKDNWLADFISRCHDYSLTQEFLRQKGVNRMELIEVPDSLFSTNSNW